MRASATRLREKKRPTDLRHFSGGVPVLFQQFEAPHQNDHTASDSESWRRAQEDRRRDWWLRSLRPLLACALLHSRLALPARTRRTCFPVYSARSHAAWPFAPYPTFPPL